MAPLDFSEYFKHIRADAADGADRSTQYLAEVAKVILPARTAKSGKKKKHSKKQKLLNSKKSVLSRFVKLLLQCNILFVSAVKSGVKFDDVNIKDMSQWLNVFWSAEKIADLKKANLGKRIVDAQTTTLFIEFEIVAVLKIILSFFEPILSNRHGFMFELGSVHSLKAFDGVLARCSKVDPKSNFKVAISLEGAIYMYFYQLGEKLEMLKRDKKFLDAVSLLQKLADSLSAPFYSEACVKAADTISIYVKIRAALILSDYCAEHYLGMNESQSIYSKHFEYQLEKLLDLTQEALKFFDGKRQHVLIRGETKQLLQDTIRECSHRFLDFAHHFVEASVLDIASKHAVRSEQLLQMLKKSGYQYKTNNSGKSEIRFESESIITDNLDDMISSVSVKKVAINFLSIKQKTNGFIEPQRGVLQKLRGGLDVFMDLSENYISNGMQTCNVLILMHKFAYCKLAFMKAKRCQKNQHQCVQLLKKIEKMNAAYSIITNFYSQEIKQLRGKLSVLPKVASGSQTLFSMAVSVSRGTKKISRMLNPFISSELKDETATCSTHIAEKIYWGQDNEFVYDPSDGDSQVFPIANANTHEKFFVMLNDEGFDCGEKLLTKVKAVTERALFVPAQGVQGIKLFGPRYRKPYRSDQGEMFSFAAELKLKGEFGDVRVAGHLMASEGGEQLIVFDRLTDHKGIQSIVSGAEANFKPKVLSTRGSAFTA